MVREKSRNLDEPDLPEPDKTEPFREGSIGDKVEARAMEIRQPGNCVLNAMYIRVCRMGQEWR